MRHVEQCAVQSPAFAWRPGLALAFVLGMLLVGCTPQAVVDCEENRECESNSCVAGRCNPVEVSDGGDTAEVLPDGGTPPDDAGDTVDQDVALDPPDDPGLDTVDVVEDPAPDAPPTGPNGCGGTVALLVDGAPGLPQTSCGATGSGILTCNGPDGLVCVGEPAPNACGGAGVLRATPGDACGCGGVWTCDDGGVVCAGGADQNACGGCSSLSSLPGYACRASNGNVGAWQCTGANAVACGAGNACGGTAPLLPAGRLPGQSCESTCGPGVFLCDGTNAMQCRPNLPCNTCGGAASLAGNKDEACGVFGDGTWQCDGADRVRCDGAAEPNACGGRESLAASPGDPCGAGRQQLCANGRLECVAVLPADVRNACGGDTLLDHQPGTPCGVCLAAQWQCDGRNAVVCPVSDAAQFNACGGCGVLSGVERTPCGACGDGRLQCTGDRRALECVGASQTPNTCGGCGNLEGSVGGDCGTCGQYTCSDATRRLVCEPRPLGSCPVSCEEIRGTCTGQNRGCIDAEGTTDARCGGCLSGFVEVAGSCTSPVLAPTNVQASDGTNAAHVTVTWSSVAGATGYHVYRGATQVTTTPVTGTSYNDTGAPAGGLPPAVTGVSATTNRTGEVQVTWSATPPPAGATQTYTVVALSGAQQSAPSSADTGYRAAQPTTRYEVEVRGTWTGVGTGTSYTDIGAPAGTITIGAPTATTTRTDGIALSVTAATTTNGANQSYRVRAVNAAGTGTSSSSATGRRSVGGATYQWQRATSSGGSYSNVSGATDRTYLDTSMVAGQERWYRVVASAPGATTATSSTSGGRRALPPTLGTTCTSDSGCSTGEWCPTNTSQRRCSPRPTVGAVQMPFQYVPAGSFTMGSPSGEVGRSSNEAQVSVTLTRSFFVQRTELTQGQWTALSGGTNPSCFQSTSGTSCTSSNANPNGPVETVSWWSVLGYANALSVSQGLPACFTLPTSGCSGTWQAGTLSCGDRVMPTVTGGNVYTCTGYRLLTEAEWEYAARAGTTTATYAGNLSGTVNDCSTMQANLDGLAWWCWNSGSRTQSVGGKTPNGWALYDMLGNVLAWTWDRWEGSSNLLGGTDPRSESFGSYRVVRGGGWGSGARDARAAFRNGGTPGFQSSILGVRLARTGP